MGKPSNILTKEMIPIIWKIQMH